MRHFISFEFHTIIWNSVPQQAKNATSSFPNSTNSAFLTLTSPKDNITLSVTQALIPILIPVAALWVSGPAPCLEMWGWIRQPAALHSWPTQHRTARPITPHYTIAKFPVQSLAVLHLCFNMKKIVFINLENLHGQSQPALPLCPSVPLGDAAGWSLLSFYCLPAGAAVCQPAGDLVLESWSFYTSTSRRKIKCLPPL